MRVFAGMIAILSRAPLVAALLLSAPAPVDAGQGAGGWLTLMDATADAVYERRVLDEKGHVLETEVLQFGESDGRFTEPVVIRSFDQNGEQSSTTNVTWQQGAGAPALGTRAAMRFAGDQISVQTDGPLLLYPKGIAGNRRLDDIQIKVTIRKGILRLLGTRTKITLTARRAEPMATNAWARRTVYRITSHIRARVFVLGIPVKRVEFLSEEYVDPSVGLLRHEMKLHDGRVAVLERMPADADGSKARYGRGGQEPERRVMEARRRTPSTPSARRPSAG